MLVNLALVPSFEALGFRVVPGEDDLRDLLSCRVDLRAALAHDGVVFIPRLPPGGNPFLPSQNPL